LANKGVRTEAKKQGLKLRDNNECTFPSGDIQDRTETKTTSDQAATGRSKWDSENDFEMSEKMTVVNAFSTEDMRDEGPYAWSCREIYPWHRVNDGVKREHNMHR